MMVKINNELLKSRNPTEHKMRLENRIGKIVQSLDDGYNLIEFEELRKPHGLKTFKNRKKLQWYVHESDFKELENK